MSATTEVMTRPRRPWRIWSMMALIAIVAVGIGVVQKFGPGWKARYDEWQKCRPVYAALGKPTNLSQPPGTALDRVLMAISARTASAAMPMGVQILVDPVGLQDAGVTMTTPVTIRDSMVPLGDSLRDVLKPLKLDYYVQGGNLIITGADERPD